MSLYPQSVCNRNVPKDVFLVADVSVCSGEIVDTYYITREGDIRTVCDWVGHKPQPAYMFHLCRLTGDTENMINAKWESHFRFNPVKQGA